MNEVIIGNDRAILLLKNVSDAELIKRAKEQQQDPAAGAEAIGELYDRYHQAVFRYIWSRVSNQQMAEDLSGDVFIRMVNNLPNYRFTGVPFQAWLFRIARNLVIDTLRKASNRNEMSLDYVIDNSISDHDPAQIVEDQIFIEQVHAGLEELKPYKQDVLVLRFIVGLSLKEVASILGKTLSSIKVTQHRALKELRTMIETQIGDENE